MKAWVGVVGCVLACGLLPLACNGSPAADEDEAGGAGGSASDASGGTASGGAASGGASQGGEAGANLGGGGAGGSGEPSGGQDGQAGADPGPDVPCPDLCHLAYAHCTDVECDSQDFECLDQCNLDRSDCLIACM